MAVDQAKVPVLQEARMLHWLTGPSICNHKAKCSAIPLWLVDMEEVLKTCIAQSLVMPQALEDHGYCSLAGLPWNDDTGVLRAHRSAPQAPGRRTLTAANSKCQARGRASQAGGGLLPSLSLSPLSKMESLNLLPS